MGCYVRSGIALDERLSITGRLKMTGAIWQYVCGGALVVAFVIVLAFAILWGIKYSDPHNGTPGKRDNDDLQNQG